jgi:hypothetical protein
VALAVQLSSYAPTARGVPRIVEDLLDMLGQRATPCRRRGVGPVAPGIERRARYAELIAHPGDLVVGLVHLDERAALRYRGVRAKKAAAFRNSFSIRSRRFSSSNSFMRARSTGDSLAGSLSNQPTERT